MRATILWTICLVLCLGLMGCESLKSTGGSEAGGGGGSDSPGGSRQQYEEVHYYYDFDDVLIHKDLKYDDSKSVVMETPQFKIGSQIFDGDIEHLDLVNFFIKNMEKDNWRMVNILKSDRSVLVFEKYQKVCMIKVTDESFSNTHVEVWLVDLKTSGSGSKSMPGGVQEQSLGE